MATDPCVAGVDVIDCSHRCCCLGVGMTASVDRWADVYRDIHANPELGFAETRTGGDCPGATW